MKVFIVVVIIVTICGWSRMTAFIAGAAAYKAMH